VQSAVLATCSVRIKKLQDRELVELLATLQEGNLDDEEIAQKTTAKLLD
jgi:hypothetical protein